ncbi:MAG: response regulator [Candidatus Omnitrophica bacterium]|nr:response regulator [Candidatus Omnitrophota bacterium]
MEDHKPNMKLEEAKTKFLAGMSNEIQRSMKDILKYSDLVKKTGLSAKQVEFVDMIYLNAHKLSWIVNDILDFCRLEIGKVELQDINFNIEYLINDIFRKAVEQKKDHPVDTYIDIAKDVPRDLVGDPTRLRQVLVNLLSNAFKYTTRGEIGIIVYYTGQAHPKVGDEISLRIIVKDSGKGIARDRRESIFEFHGREDPAMSWEFGGTGLGLAICKLIVESMGGTITVESEEGKGSEFIVTFPFIKGQPLREKGFYPLTRKELVGKKAIIVDDNEIARKILNKCCETMGIDVLLISASPKAVLQMLDDSLIEGELPDLILCDLMMPEMDGYELARTIRANDGFRGIKLIAVTSAVRVGGAKNAQDSGFNGFLPKPVFLDELAKVIATVLGGQQENGPIVTRHMVEELEIKGNKILVVDPNASDQMLIKECLTAMDCEGEFVPNGQRAIECLKEKIYSLCLLDLDVFQEEGGEIVKVIKEVSRNMPTVVLLSTDTKEQRSRCLDAGVDDFIGKPVDMVSLRRVVARYSEK